MRTLAKLELPETKSNKVNMEKHGVHEIKIFMILYPNITWASLAGVLSGFFQCLCFFHPVFLMVVFEGKSSSFETIEQNRFQHNLNLVITLTE